MPIRRFEAGPYEAVRAVSSVSIDGYTVSKTNVAKRDFSVASRPDIEPFSFFIYLPQGETEVLSTTFVPHYGSHAKVLKALEDGRLKLSGDLKLQEFMWNQFDLSAIHSFAFRANAIGW